jgi:hypothetical protein
MKMTVDPAEIARSVLQNREFIASELEQAITNKDQRLQRSLRSTLKKLDKLIVDYGLGRYAASRRES